MKITIKLILVLFCFFLNSQIKAQETPINGNVTDESGVALGGANVVVKGKSIGTSTDFDGNFILENVELGEVLVFSYTGFQTQEILAATNMIVSLIPGNELDEVIITGVFDPRTRMEASVAISTMGAAELQKVVPTSSVDMLKNLPGVYVNSSAGEIQNSVYTRGLNNQTSGRGGNGFRYVSMQEDGLPVIAIAGNLSPDGYLRADATIKRIEAVRGGTASILGPNAPGGIFNYVSKVGGPEFAGEFRARTGLEGDGKNLFLRGDFNVGGALSKDKTWRYNIGGFYRNADGPKNPGYTLSYGGQLKANIAKLYDSGSLKVTFKYLNDNTAPFEFTPTIGFENPQVAPGFDNTSSLLIQPQQFTIPRSQTSLDKDLEFDSENVYGFDELAIGLNWEQRFGEGWKVGINSRYSAKDFLRNSTAVVSPIPVFQQGFPFFWFFSGNAVRPGDYEFYNTQTGESYGSVNQGPPSFGMGPPSFDLTNNGLNLPGSNVLENHVLYNPGIYFETEMNDLVSQITLSKKLENMSFTGGLYYANTKFSSINYISIAASVATYEDKPVAVGIRYTDPGGNVADATSTSGLLGVGGGIFGPSVVNNTVNQTALFFGHNWDITDKLNLDWGIRLENFNIDQTFQTATGGEFDEDSGGADGDVTTLYDNSRYTLNPEEGFEKDLGFSDTFAFSAGLNYRISENVAIYGRYSTGRKTPDLQFYADPGILNDVGRFNIESEEITSIEMGLKLRTKNLNLFVTPFYSSLANVPIYLTFQDDTSASLDFYVPDLFFKAYNSYGVEIEANWQISDKFDLRGVATIQDSNIPEFQTWIEGEGPADDEVLTIEDANNANIGNMLVLTPTYTSGKFSASLNYQFMGERWANEVNAFKLPAFHAVDLNLSYNINNHLNLGININNVFDTYGIMSWERPGDFTNAQNTESFRAEDLAANPNAVYTTQSILPRAYFTSLTYRF